jgi:integrase
VGEAPDHRSESLRIDEARALYAAAGALAAGGDRGALAALVALVCSLRPSELAQVEVRDVDDGGRVLWVAGAQLKTDNTRRRMEIADPQLAELLAAAAKGRPAADRLFGLQTRRGITDNVRRVCESALGRAVTPRELRRTFATLASRAGRSLDEVAFGMGHGADANARTAKRHYIQPGATEAGQATRVLGVLDGGRTAK